MNTTVANLNILDALKNSLPFCLEFAKKHRIITALFAAFYFLNSLLRDLMMPVVRHEAGLSTHFDPLALTKAVYNTMFSAKFVLPSVLLIIFISVVGYLVIYYAIRMAIGQLDPSIPLASRSLLKSVWQLFCMHLLIGITAIPLYLLLIIPGIWWSIRMSVATANLLSTNDGPIESIKKSFQLTDKKFWPCFGYLLGTLALPSIIFTIVIGVFSLSIAVPAVFCFHLNLQDDWHMLFINGLIQALATLFLIFITYFCHAWLYVYLKSQNELIAR